MALAAFHAAIPTAQRAVTLLRQLDEKLSLAFGLTLLGRVLASRPEEREAADRLIDEALEIYEAVRTGAADTRNDEGELVRLLTNALAASYKAMTIDPRELDRRREILTESFARFSLLSPGYFIIGVILENLSEVELEAGNYELALARALESVEFYRHSSSGFGSLFALNGAGTATLASGDVDASRGHALELLWRVRRIGSAPGLAMALLLLAAIEASTRDGVLAAGLLGAWETSAGRIDTPPATTNYLCSRTREALARSLDDEALEAAVAAGRRWSVEDAINVALMVAENR
jgi:tetratricopeptide (TPR) repeat protein